MSIVRSSVRGKRTSQVKRLSLRLYARTVLDQQSGQCATAPGTQPRALRAAGEIYITRQSLFKPCFLVNGV